MNEKKPSLLKKVLFVGFIIYLLFVCTLFAQIGALSRYHQYQMADKTYVYKKIEELANTYTEELDVAICETAGAKLDVKYVREELEKSRNELQNQQQKYKELIQELQNSNYKIPEKFLQ